MGKKVQDKDGYWGEWVYSHKSNSAIFIRDGETIQDAFARHVLSNWNKRDTKIEKDQDVNTYLEDYEKKNLSHEDIGIGGYMRAYKDWMRKHRVDDETVQDIQNLMHLHSGSESQQKEADRKIVEALESNTKLGQALEHQIQFEEKLYKVWSKAHEKDDKPWQYKIYPEGKRIFRKGERKEQGIEC